jgi:hypothetical protein
VPETPAEGYKPIIMLDKPLRPCALVPHHILHRDRVILLFQWMGVGGGFDNIKNIDPQTKMST